MRLSKEALQLAKDLDLNVVDAYMMDLKASLYRRCAKAIKNSSLTHSQIATSVGTSRARISRLSNMGENNISMELLIKIVATLEKESPIKVA